jgi:Zn finger protein HypA/HybF involved in hydrogenase expression
VSQPETIAEDDLAELGNLTGDEPWLQWIPPPALCRCQRCPHSWHRRTLGYLPVQCPNCKSPRWNVPRKNR